MYIYYQVNVHDKRSISFTLEGINYETLNRGIIMKIKNRKMKTGLSTPWFSRWSKTIKGIFIDMLLNSYRKKETVKMNTDIKKATHTILTELSRGFAAGSAILDVEDKGQRDRITNALGHMSGILANGTRLLSEPAVVMHLQAALEDIWATCQRGTRDTLTILMSTASDLSKQGEPVNTCVERIIDHGMGLANTLRDMTDHVEYSIDSVENLATKDARQSLSDAIQTYVTKIKVDMVDNEVELDVETLAASEISRAMKRAKLDGVVK